MEPDSGVIGCQRNDSPAARHERGIMFWMLLPFRRYAQFAGRSRPIEYWMFVLFVFLAMIALSFVDAALGLGASTRYFDYTPYGVTMGVYNQSGILTALFWLVALIPGLAVTVRRLHDSDKSGWWLLIGFLPLIGTAILAIFMVIGGTHGPNRFGPDPIQGPAPQ
jgi:uncharacterized membrane protein YhaH (DUF805 family)